MATIQHTIEVKAPLNDVYQQLTKFEEYPRFMEEAEAVHQTDDTHLHWTTKMANRSVEWDAEITQQEPNHCIVWRNVSGPTNSGKVELHALTDDSSQVTFTLHAEPEQVPGSMAGYTEEDMALRLHHDLGRLKNLMEANVAGSRAQHGGDANLPTSTANRTEVANAPAQEKLAAPPVPMRHLGQLPQDTSAEKHSSTATSDSMGKSGAPLAQESLHHPDQAHTAEAAHAASGNATTSPDNTAVPVAAKDASVDQNYADTAAVVGSLGGTDAAAGAHLSGSKGGGPGGTSLRQDADAAGIPDTPGGMLQGDTVSPAADANAAGSGLGSAASAEDTRTGTGTSSGSGTALTGGGTSGAQSAGNLPIRRTCHKSYVSGIHMQQRLY